MTRLLILLALLPLIGAPTVCLVGCQESSAPGATQRAAADQATVEPPVAGAAPAKDAVQAPSKTVGAAPVEPRRSRLPKGKNDITFDDLKFDIEKGQTFEPSMLTESIEALDGKRVKIRGYILPTFQQTGLKTFVLVRDNLECCFGPGAMIYDCIDVEMTPDHTAEFTTRPITVDGTFHIREFKLSGRTLAIYHLDSDKAE